MALGSSTRAETAGYTAAVAGGGHDAFSRPGSEIGRYRLIRRLAVGGMAEIFLAHVRQAHGFEKLVVVKRILPQYAESPDFVRMFLDEARLAGTLDHPNIAHVYDIGEHDGSFFFAMEYVHGQSLLKVMRTITTQRRPLPLEHALNIVISTCAGLHYAHEKVGFDGTPLGIVHRDVSPPNVIITYDGMIKVVDFGIAKAATAKSSTAVGTLKGKVPYMSPEQCLSQPVDRRSDVFSIGILLYELTVGRRLFQAETEAAIIRRITSGGFPPPTSHHPHYPGELEAIVMRSLQLSAQTRYQTARQLQIELEEFAREYKLSQSSAQLSAFMEQLYDEEERRWPTNPNLAVETSPGPADIRSATRPGASSSPDSGELEAYDSALSRLLDGDTDAQSATSGLGETPREDLGIDLDNLQVEDLVPSKFSKD